MELLLLSSSRTPAGYFTEYLAEIKAFTAGLRHAVFVPFAAVTLPWADYAKRVSEATGLALHSIDEIDKADLVVVGGGNTFQLLYECRRRALLDRISRAARHENVKYLGWSAGANLACPTIKTTNDMPIVEPPSFDALGLVPFQINPHYLDPEPGSTHMGETREQRIVEFLEENDRVVVGLREGGWIRSDERGLRLGGLRGARIFRRAAPPEERPPGASLDDLC